MQSIKFETLNQIIQCNFALLYTIKYTLLINVERHHVTEAAYLQGLLGSCYICAWHLVWSRKTKDEIHQIKSKITVTV